MDEDIIEQLKKVMEASGETAAKFAESLGVSPSFLSNILHGKKSITANVLKGLAKRGVDLNILLTGMPSGGEDLATELAKVQKDLAQCSELADLQRSRIETLEQLVRDLEDTIVENNAKCKKHSEQKSKTS